MSRHLYEDQHGGRHTRGATPEPSLDDAGSDYWESYFDYPHTPDGQRYNYEGTSRENFYRTRGRWAGA